MSSQDLPKQDAPGGLAKPLRLAHISDMHCYRLSLNPAQILSKRWIGNVNVLFNRRLMFDPDPCHNLTDLLLGLDLDHVLVSGDLTTTTLPEELFVAKRFVEELREKGLGVHIVPGNHDMYTRKVHRKKLFYQYFEVPSNGDQLTLRDDKVAVRPLSEKWWWIGIDAAIPTSLLSSKGRFTRKTEKNLEKALASVPKGVSVVMVNHFPLFPSIHPSHDMEGARALRNLLTRWPCVKLYLHGHIHRQSITDERDKGLPILLNSGSCGFKRKATCHVIDLSDQSCKIAIYGRSKEGGESEPWSFKYQETFAW